MRRGLMLGAAALLAIAACSGSGGADNLPVAPATSPVTTLGADDTATPASSDITASAPSSSTTEAAKADDGVIAVSTGDVGAPFDRRLLGTNIPAWIGPQRLSDPTFQQQAVASGATVLRMPGGSWSSSYDWLACENGDGDSCFWTWAARPSDYLAFLRATGMAGMWTVSFNGTAQEAAALVAFFNGSVDDQRSIGVDRHGKDWGTVGQWASLRADHGSPEPYPLALWEVGNEVYGAKSSAGEDCASWGWEDVWTCNGDDYVNGDDEHDGFLAFRDAMRAVDPTIAVGAVGVADPSSWSDFGTDVIDGTKGALDFYVVHDYGFGSSESDDDVLARPTQAWPDTMKSVVGGLHDAGETVPVAITEYNLVSFLDGDTDAQMTKVVNALYLADTIGQMAVNGVTLANQWNFANGAAANGADYGMLNVDTGARYPQYYALAMWSRFGDQLLPVSSGFDAEDTLAAYAASNAAGGYTVLAINKTSDPVDATIRLAGATGNFDAVVDVASAAGADDTTMSFDGLADPPIDLSSVAPQDLGVMAGSIQHSFPPYSISVVGLTPVP